MKKVKKLDSQVCFLDKGRHTIDNPVDDIFSAFIRCYIQTQWQALLFEDACIFFLGWCSIPSP